MREWRDLDAVRQTLPLDDWTADRLLAGMVDPDDAPPGYAGLARALGQARGPAEAGEFAGWDGIVAAVAAAVAEASPPTTVSTPLRRRSMFSRMLGTKVAAASLAAVLLGTGVAAANGSLPDIAQSLVSDAAGNVGIDLPDAADHEARKAEHDAAKTDRESARAARKDAHATQKAQKAAEKLLVDVVVNDDVIVDPAPQKDTPTSQEGQDAHYIQGLRHDDDPTTDWKAERDRIHADRKESHPARDDAPTGEEDPRKAAKESATATFEDAKAELKAAFETAKADLKTERDARRAAPDADHAAVDAWFEAEMADIEAAFEQGMADAEAAFEAAMAAIEAEDEGAGEAADDDADDADEADEADDDADDAGESGKAKGKGHEGDDEDEGEDADEDEDDDEDEDEDEDDDTVVDPAV